MNEIVWKLIPRRDNLDLTEIVVNIANGKDINLSNYEVLHVYDYIFEFRNEIVEYLINHGFNSLVSTDFIFEDIIKRGITSKKKSEIIKMYVKKLDLANELIIIDPYFFAKSKNPDYVDVLLDILDSYIDNLKTLRIITNSYDINGALKKIILDTLRYKNNDLKIVHFQNNGYHDRFWINRLNHTGFVMGTSLNGVGNKIALIDKLSTSDVKTIIEELDNDKLL